jgi:hypothetical protein
MIIEDSLARRNECIAFVPVASKILVDLLGIVMEVCFVAARRHV